jgi:hypothetical protein
MELEMNKEERNVPTDEVLSMTPRQLSGHDWSEILNKFPTAAAEGMFTKTESQQAIKEAQRVTLPGLYAVYETLADSQTLLKANQVGEYELTNMFNLTDGKVVVASILNGVTGIKLYEYNVTMNNCLGHDVSYMLQHYALDETVAKKICGSIRARVNLFITEHESNKEVYYGLDELIVELPRSVKVGELLSYIGVERKFTAVRITEIVEHMKTVAGY